VQPASNYAVEHLYSLLNLQAQVSVGAARDLPHNSYHAIQYICCEKQSGLMIKHPIYSISEHMTNMKNKKQSQNTSAPRRCETYANSKIRDAPISLLPCRCKWLNAWMLRCSKQPRERNPSVAQKDSNPPTRFPDTQALLKYTRTLQSCCEPCQWTLAKLTAWDFA
jgi:hypothetical protein